MPDVFVSYSRRDQVFVRELVARLSDEGKESWVDWEGIPPTAAWLEEIYAAIEGSDAFLFVISPASAASSICREELDHADKLGKRIVPVNLGDVQPSELPPALADRQWIAFDDGKPFDEALSTLVEALDTDLDWLRLHTQWLGKAREWERNGRDRSFLLRGSELRAAESWLTTPRAAEKEPPATPLQNEYVLASRQAATRRQRVLVTAVSVALLVTLALAFVALLQRNRAVDERKTAVSELLASLSVQRLDSDLDTALLLGAAAYDVKPTAEATNALLVGVQRTDRVQGVIRALPGPTTASDLSGDGRVLALAGGGELAMWDVTLGERLASTSPPGSVQAIALTRDGSALAAIADDRVVFYRTGGPEGLRPWNRAASAIPRQPRSLAFSPSGRTLAVGTENGLIALVDVETNRRTSIVTERPPAFEGRPMPIGPLMFSGDGSRLAAGSPIGVHFVEMRPQARYRGLHELPGVRALAFAGNEALALATGDGRLVVVDPSTGRRLCGPSMADITSVGVGGRGQVAIGSESGVVRLARGPCSKPSGRLDGHGSEIALVRYTEDTSRLVSLDAGSVAVLWSPTRSTLVQRLEAGPELSSDVVWGAGGGEVVVANETGVWVVRPGAAPKRIEASPSRVSALASASGAEVLAASGEEAIGLWRGAEYAPASEPLPRAQGLDIALSSDGTMLAAGTTGAEVELLDLTEDGEKTALSTGGDGYVTALAFGEDDGVLAAGDNTGRVVLWKLGGQTKALALTKSEAGSRVEALAFAASEPLLAIGWSDGRLTFWDVDESREIPLPNRQQSLSDLAFSASGEHLISADTTGVLYVWDVDGARALGEAFATGIEPIEALDTSSSTGDLAAVASYGSLALVRPTLWDADAAAERVCEIVGRSLTDAERGTLASGLEIPRTCER